MSIGGILTIVCIVVAFFVAGVTAPLIQRFFGLPSGRVLIGVLTGEVNPLQGIGSAVIWMLVFLVCYQCVVLLIRWLLKKT